MNASVHTEIFMHFETKDFFMPKKHFADGIEKKWLTFPNYKQEVKK